MQCGCQEARRPARVRCPGPGEAALTVEPLRAIALEAWDWSAPEAGERLAGFTARGFAQALAPLPTEDLLDRDFDAARAVAVARDAGLALLVDLQVDRLPLDHPLVQAEPQAFAVRRSGDVSRPIDPRKPALARGIARARLGGDAARAVLGPKLRDALAKLAAAGVAGFRVRKPDAAPADFWRGLIDAFRDQAPAGIAIAQTPGLAREAATALDGFDYLVSSIAWWDLKARWLIEEYETLREHGRLIAAFEEPRVSPALVRVGGAVSAGLIVGETVASASPELAAAIDAAAVACQRGEGGELRVLTSAGSKVTALAQVPTGSVRDASEALLVIANGSAETASLAADEVLPAIGGDFEPVDAALFEALAPGEVRTVRAARGRRIVRRVGGSKPGASSAARKPRLVVEGIDPCVDGGQFPVRRIVGERVAVEADVFGDGHEQLGVELQWRPTDSEGWQTAAMAPLGNDRWTASFVVDRLGRYEFAVEGWIDLFGGFQRDFGKKLAAGVAQAVDEQEGRLLIERARERAGGELKDSLTALLAQIDAADVAERATILLSDEARALMRAADHRPFRLRSEPQLVDAERLQARFASWYELFPRSMSDSPERHGTFDDVIAQLPRVRAMGFDVLYFPPIHPIGAKHRKGKNNSLTPGPDDPGSPYAIGSEDGGHDAIHPELGSFADFRRLVAAAAEHGLEIALDFAVQCSPDHPWLKEHPGWFDWRPDGTIKYAENPPKKYQDIVNVDFYAADAVPDLWCALKDIVLLWVREGVKTFRVDNPHTKPLAFWEWLIREVRAQYPETIFLAEAFTRPKVMYRLAKIGFSQSYTYFTWRNEKQELIDYLVELTTTAPKEFFRPHFFVNTPDINPVFLQTSGPAGFKIRAALAATLSGLLGVYSGFELCEWEPVPGKEEYLDSEKYEIRPRDWSGASGPNIIHDITLLNAIRKGHPALQTHLGVKFYGADNDRVLYFGKALPSKADMVLVAISLDPHGAQGADIEVPLWEFGLPDDGAVAVEDLVGGGRFDWRGKRQRVELTPDQPYAIWRIEPRR